MVSPNTVKIPKKLSLLDIYQEIEIEVLTVHKKRGNIESRNQFLGLDFTVKFALPFSKVL